MSNQKLNKRDVSHLVINEDCHNIWRYVEYYENPPAVQYRLTLEEGGTKCLHMPLIAKELGLTALFFKREDLNPNGSHKDRSLAFQVSQYWGQQAERLLISSSGNAGISAAAYAALIGMKMFVFVSPHTPFQKIQQIRQFGGQVIVSERAISFAKHISRQLDIPNLRPSTNPYSSQGFQSIGFELFEQLKTIDAIFTFVSSASSLVGMGLAFHALKQHGLITKLPQLHAVQTGLANHIASHFVESSRILSQTRSVVGDLGAKKTALADQAIGLIRESGGSGWLVGDEDILVAAQSLRSHGLSTSMEGCAVFAALRQAVMRHGDLGHVVCVLTGHYSQWQDLPKSPTPLPILNSFSEIAAVIDNQ